MQFRSIGYRAGTRVAGFLAICTVLVVLPTPALAVREHTATRADTTASATERDSTESLDYLLRHARPSIGIQYGLGDVDRDGFGGSLASVGALEVLLGFHVEQRLGGEDALLRQRLHGVFVGNLASRLATDAPMPSEIGTDLWRFGVFDGGGSGYRFASQRGRLMLLNTGTAGWYTLDVDGEAVPALPPVDAAKLEQFTSHTRFGESWESSVEVGIGDMVALHAGFERTAVFPSFKFWYWLLSGAIDHIALKAADVFADHVEAVRPPAAPIVRFLFVGALQYGFYELRLDEVNWPFDTEPPLAYDMFKFGVNTRF